MSQQQGPLMTPEQKQRAHAAFPNNLTPAEARALMAVIDHGEDKRAANAIGIALPTLRSHTKAARHKAGVTSTIRLVVLYLQAKGQA